MDMPYATLAFLPGGLPGWAEILVILALGVLLFGKRLPEVGRNVGRGIVEFKKGLKGIEHDVEDAVNPPDPPHAIGHDAQPTGAGTPMPTGEAAADASGDASSKAGGEHR